MSNPTITIDNLTLRVPQNWQGDPVMLARQVANALQNHAQRLQTQGQLKLSLKSLDNGQLVDISGQIGQQLQASNTTDLGGHHD